MSFLAVEATIRAITDKRHTASKGSDLPCPRLYLPKGAGMSFLATSDVIGARLRAGRERNTGPQKQLSGTASTDSLLPSSLSTRYSALSVPIYGAASLAGAIKQAVLDTRL